MTQLPPTQDFDHYSTEHEIATAVANGPSVGVRWNDGRESHYDVFLLRENSPDTKTIHPESRELLLSPLDIPEKLQALSATINQNGSLRVTWSCGKHSDYHPGWLRAHAWFIDGDNDMPLPPVSDPVEWDASVLEQPPSFNGPDTLSDNKHFLNWLESLAKYGIARLQHLPDEDGLLERVVRTIGPPRESNFGPHYVLEIKDEPDSNAFTAGALLQHIDMPTRECPHGLQFLYCRANSTAGGEGIYVDGFRVARDIRLHEPAAFRALTDIPWVFNNRSRTSDYRAAGPVIALDEQGRVAQIRLTAWLRAPLKAPLNVQREAYSAVRLFTRYAQNAAYQLIFRYEPGDLLAFDNRRVLHGRREYDATTGRRTIEGMYADRDELYSRIRTLRRELNR